MKKLGRSHDDRTDHLHDIDASLCYGPSHVTVACEYFCNAAQMTLKGSHLLIETGIDMVGRNGASQATSITYLIELEDIIDVHKIVAEVDEKQQDIQDGIVVLLSDQKACLISAVHQPLCLKVLVNSWQTHLMRCAARLHRPHALAAGSDGISVTREYYSHFIQALRSSASVDDFVSLLTEYSKEVMSNQTLKLITFETKELLTIALQVWKTLLLRVPVWADFEGDAKWKQLAPTDTKKRAVLYSVIKSANSSSIDSQILQDEYNQYLLTIAGNRLAILSIILQTLVSIFFGSELITDRVDSVTSDSIDSVLGLSNWLTVLCTDTLPTIAEAIGLSEDVLQAQMESATERPGIAAQTPRLSLLSMLSGGGGGGSFRVSPFTPSKLPMKAMATDKNAIEAVPLLYKDVKHRQSLIFFEVLRIVDNERCFMLSFSNVSKNNSLYALPDYLINYNHVDDIEVQRMRLLVREGKQQVSARKQAKLFTALKLNCISDYIGQVRDWDGMLDMWVGMLLDSMDQLLSSQNIRLHNGVAVSAPNLAASRAPSFRSVDTSYSNTSAYDGRENRLCYPVVRIFYLSHILHYLAMDSSHVREVLSKELLSHWSSVMSIFQIICPHQSINVKVSQNESLNSARKNSLQRQNSVSSAPNSARVSGRDSFVKDSPFRKLSRSESRRSVLTNVLASSMSRMLSTRGSFSIKQSQQVPSLSLPSNNTEEAAALPSEPIIDNTRSSTAFSCGPIPRHGLSVASWRLLVICRLRCESLIFDVLKIPEASILASKENVLHEQVAENDDDDDDLELNLPPIYPTKLKRRELQISTGEDDGAGNLDGAVDSLSGGIAAITSPSAAEGRKSARFLVSDEERQGSINGLEKELSSPIYTDSPSAVNRKRVRMFSE